MTDAEAVSPWARLKTKLQASLGPWWERNRSDTSLPSMVTVLWCVAICAHFDSRMYWDNEVVYAYAHWVALIGIILGRCAWWQLLVWGLQVWAVIGAMPTPDNHWFFSGFVSLAMMTCIVPGFIRGRGRLDDTDWARWHENTVPILRVMIILLYVFAVFHKLNWGYIDPQKSCGMHFYMRAVRARWFIPLDGDPPLWFRHFMDYGILLLEASIPVFLAWRRTWFVGVFFGISFHLMTAVFMRHFPTIMIALYFSYMPYDLARRFVTRIDDWIRHRSRGLLNLNTVILIQAAWLSAWAVHIEWVMDTFNVRKTTLGTGYVLMLRVWGSLLSAGFLACIVVCIRTRSFLEYSPRPFFSRYYLAYIFPVILFVNGFSPFFGLKTSTSIAMWSNLIVANNQSNHMFIPTGSLRLFPYMDDLVLIRKTNVEVWRKRYVRPKRLVPYIMLNRWMASRAQRNRTTELEFERDGKLYTYKHAELDPELTAPQPWWFQKLVHVKSFERKLTGRCTW